MPRLAARVWRTDHGYVGGKDGVSFRLSDKTAYWLSGNLYARPVDVKEFCDVIEKLSPGKPTRSTNVLMEYFENAGERAIPIFVVNGQGYDFILHSEGLDLFIPPNPAKAGSQDDEENADDKKFYESDDGKTRALREILRMYRFRALGTPPIALPRYPIYPLERNGRPAKYPFPSIQMNTPTGPSLPPEDWVKGLADLPSDRPRRKKLDWWITGAAYRGIMAELPRIVASLWHELASDYPTGADDSTTYEGRFHEQLKSLLQQRVETTLFKKMNVIVGKNEAPRDAGETWKQNDVMITNDGLYVLDPTLDSTDGETMVTPSLESVLLDIESGVAGNPVFTDSWPGDPPL
jgi:hypothetical protein